MGFWYRWESIIGHSSTGQLISNTAATGSMDPSPRLHMYSKSPLEHKKIRLQDLKRLCGWMGHSHGNRPKKGTSVLAASRDKAARFIHIHNLVAICIKTAIVTYIRDAQAIRQLCMHRLIDYTYVSDPGIQRAYPWAEPVNKTRCENLYRRGQSNAIWPLLGHHLSNRSTQVVGVNIRAQTWPWLADFK